MTQDPGVPAVSPGLRFPAGEVRASQGSLREEAHPGPAVLSGALASLPLKAVGACPRGRGGLPLCFVSRGLLGAQGGCETFLRRGEIAGNLWGCPGAVISLRTFMSVLWVKQIILHDVDRLHPNRPQEQTLRVAQRKEFFLQTVT